jgi:hypothetical protein
MRAYSIAALFAALLVGCGRDPVAPPVPSEPTWKLLATGETFVDVWGSSPNAVFALGEASLFFYNGSNWTVLPDPPVGSRAIWGTSPEKLFLIADADGGVSPSGLHGDIYHYDGHAWELVADRPFPLFRLWDIWGSSDRDIFAVGERGIILHFDGSAWSQMPIGTGSDLLCLWGTSSSDVYAAGTEGTVLHYDGSSWSNLSTEPSWKIRGIWASSRSDIYCVSTDLTLDEPDDSQPRTVLHYDGSSWSPVMTQWMLWAVWGSSSTDVFVAGDDGAILHWDGSSWSQRWVSNLSARAIWGSSSKHVFVVGGGSNVLRSDTGYDKQGSLLLHYDGTEWRPQASSIALPYLLAVYGVGGSSATDIYFVGGSTRWSEAFPVIQRFDGSSFGLGALLNDSHPFSDVWATSDGVFAVNYQNVACFDHSLGEESVWEEILGTCVWATSRVNAFVAYAGGEIYHYDGSAWNLMTTGTTGFFDIWGSSETDVFAVGWGGTIVHYDGSSWASMPTGTSVTLHGVWGSSSTDVYAVGDAGTILHYDGVQWKAVPSMTTNRLTGVWGSSDRDVFVVGGIILHYDGQIWTTMGTSHHADKVWGSGAGDVYVTAGNRILHYGVE